MVCLFCNGHKMANSKLLQKRFLLCFNLLLLLNEHINLPLHHPFKEDVLDLEGHLLDEKLELTLFKIKTLGIKNLNSFYLRMKWFS